VILLGISVIAGIIYTYGFHRQLAADDYSVIILVDRL
jgi:hypothetical protein